MRKFLKSVPTLRVMIFFCGVRSESHLHMLDSVFFNSVQYILVLLAFREISAMQSLKVVGVDAWFPPSRNCERAFFHSALNDDQVVRYPECQS